MPRWVVGHHNTKMEKKSFNLWLAYQELVYTLAPVVCKPRPIVALVHQTYGQPSLRCILRMIRLSAVSACLELVSTMTRETG